MSYQTLYVTHVEISYHHFIKIHGQTNRLKARNIEIAMPTVYNVFASFPPPVMNMLQAECMVLVYYRNSYHRGKFVRSDAGKTANVLLIDYGYMVNIELANLRVLSLAPASEFLVNEPALASEFVLNRCIVYNDNLLSKIQEDILNGEYPFNIDDEFGNIKRISLHWNNRDYTDHLINARICQEISAESQKKYLSPKPATLTAAVQLPVNKTTSNNNNNATNAGRTSINTQMINNYLTVGNKNMPSFQSKVSPSMDFNSNQSPVAAPPNDQQLSAHLMPTFISDILIVRGRHQVYVTHVDNGPYMFSVQLKSSEPKMAEMMAAIAKWPLTPLSRKPELGMACLARFSADNVIYRAVINSIDSPDKSQLLYVDYGNSDAVTHNHIYDIPDQFLRLKTFAIRVSLAGLAALPALSDQAKTAFKEMVADKTFDMVVLPAEGKNVVQCCELSFNGDNMLNRLKDIEPKFIEPTDEDDDSEKSNGESSDYDTADEECVICGLGTYNESTTWVQCSNCKRWTHVDCVDTFTNNFFCVNCVVKKLKKKDSV